MHESTTGMETTRTVLLVLGLLFLTCLASGLSETKADQSGTFSVEDYSDWLENHTINVVNYVAEVGTDVAILSPISPPPFSMRWFSLNFDGELRPPVGREVGRVGSTKSENFLETYNTSWESVFKFDKLNRWLRIRKVQLGYSDLLRVFVGENGTGETAGRGSEECQAFDVAITLMTFEKHECGFTSKPQNPKAGDTLILSCSVIVNGLWNASLIFRNNYDEREIVRETKTCGIQRSLGSKICSSVRVRAETDILAYSCLLGFLSDGKHVPKHPMFQNSKWTADFNKKVVCNLPKINLGAIPSDVTLLCNNMPCGETVFVNDTVTCVAHGYPQPVFDLHIRDVSEETGNNSESQGVDYEDRFFMDTDEEERDDGFGGDYTKAATAVEIKGHEDFRIGLTNVGHIEITCNVSNALGWGYNSLVLEVKLKHDEGDAMETAVIDEEATAAGGNFLMEVRFVRIQVLCNSVPCDDKADVNVGEPLHLIYYVTSTPVYYRTTLYIDNEQKTEDEKFMYKWSVIDIGTRAVRIETTSPLGNHDWYGTFYVFAAAFGRANILCNYWPCLNGEIMQVGARISLYFDWRAFQWKQFRWTVNLPASDGNNRVIWFSWYYTLDVEDLGEKLIKFQLYVDSRDESVERTIQVTDTLTGIDILCNGKVCKDNETMRFGDEISCYFRPRFMLDRITFTLLIDNYVKVEAYPCTYVLKEEDVGSKLVECDSKNKDGEAGTFQATRNIYVTCEFRDEVVLKPAKKRVIIGLLCGEAPCDKPGRTIYTGTYVSCRTNGGQRTALKFTVNNKLISWKLPAVLSEIYYKLRDADIGSANAICSANGTDDVPVDFTVVKWPCADLPASANLFGQPIGIDVMCNDKVCQDNEVMRFGDKISCNFEPKFMIDGLTFTLLIDNYTKVEGYPCTYALREEDVGSKSVKCNSQDTEQLFENTRNITVICEFRDEVVLKPAKKAYDVLPYEFQFRKDNVTVPSGVIILCGNEPCNKPGRTIYTGTYVICRLNDGKMTNLKLFIKRNWINWQNPVTSSELAFKLKTTGETKAECHGDVYGVNSTTTVIFIVHKWPCSNRPGNVKPASADIFEYENAADENVIPGGMESSEHGEAAGAIDVDQAENTDPGPAASDKDAPKWNDGMTAEKSAGDDKPKPSIGSGRESFVLLQLFLAFIAAFVGLGQF